MPPRTMSSMRWSRYSTRSVASTWTQRRQHGEWSAGRRPHCGAGTRPQGSSRRRRLLTSRLAADRIPAPMPEFETAIAESAASGSIRSAAGRTPGWLLGPAATMTTELLRPRMAKAGTATAGSPTRRPSSWLCQTATSSSRLVWPPDCWRSEGTPSAARLSLCEGWWRYRRWLASGVEVGSAAVDASGSVCDWEVGGRVAGCAGGEEFMVVGGSLASDTKLVGFLVLPGICRREYG
jgi:hypothetical protein